MATIVSDELTSQVSTLYAGTDKFYAVLLNSGGATYNALSQYVDIVKAELDPDIGGYTRQEFSYAAGDINTYNAGVSVDPKRVTFTHSGIPLTQWTVTNVAVIRSLATRSTINVKPIVGEFLMDATAVDTALDRITLSVADYTDLQDSDRVTVFGYQSAPLPAGLALDTYYYIKKVGSNQVELYSDAGLTTKIDITGVANGTAYFRNAIGTFCGIYTLGSAINVAPTQSVLYDISFNQGQ